MSEPQRHIIDVSWEALLKVVALGVGLWLVYVLRDVVVMLFIVFTFVAAVNPVIVRLQRRMPRTVAVALFYAVLAVMLFAIAYAFVPLFTQQVNDLVHILPTVIVRSRELLTSVQSQTGRALTDQAITSLTNQFNAVSQALVSNTISFFGGVLTLITAVVISFYLLLEESNAKKFFYQILPRHRFEVVYETVRKISERLGSWVRGQAILMLIIGLSNLVIYLAIGIKSPLPLALWAGICELIPYIGPAIGMLPALVVAFTTGNVLQIILVIALNWFLIQQLEGHFIVPRVMSKAVGLSPVLVILALLIGFQLFGIAGSVFAIPLAAAVAVVVEEWSHLKKLWE